MSAPMTLADLSPEDREFLDMIRSISPEQLLQVFEHNLSEAAAGSPDAAILANLCDLARARVS